MKNWMIGLVLLLALSFGSCKTQSGTNPEQKPQDTPRVPPVAQLEEKKEPEMQVQRPAMPTAEEIKQMQNEYIIFDTDEGIIKLELFPEAAPMTCFNFRNLTEEGFYDGTIFHRVIRDFMIQGGGFTPNMPKQVPYQFKDEINPDALKLDPQTVNMLQQKGYVLDFSLPSIRLDYGVLAMANAGPNTNGSQFFIITKKDGTDWLNGMHTGFGRVVEGMEIVSKIEKTSTDQMDRPVGNIMIRKATVVSK
jgi:cyclophilin family peptidyl-prolyl cis-trans isomerase